MRWERTATYCETSSEGYKVSAVKVGGRWTFAAWSPPDMPRLTYREWLETMSKVHYEIGEPVPRRCRLLGQADTADSARRICRVHFEQAGERQNGNQPEVTPAWVLPRHLP
jgi:hypothetical protein